VPVQPDQPRVDHRFVRTRTAELGYDFPGDIGIVGERLFGRGAEILTHLVHVVQADGPKCSEYLDFRDSLRMDPNLAIRYDEIKREPG
jgi:GrpB-like predicted nucleotidyltransferase (UPF0157 family)